MVKCKEVANSLTADRATTLVPVLAAELIFIAILFIDLGRLQAGDALRDAGTLFVNIELHSVAFSVLFFWLIPAVLKGALIGTSQTENAIPNTLRKFRNGLIEGRAGVNLKKLDTTKLHWKYRWLFGTYSLQPRTDLCRWNKIWCHHLEERRLLHKSPPSFVRWPRIWLLYVWPFIYFALPFFIVAYPVFIGIAISYNVAPGGWMCRTWGELYFLLGWLASWVCTKVLICCFQSEGLSPTGLFWSMLAKDSLGTFIIIMWIGLTQFGWYNKAECYRSHEGAIIPPMQPVAYGTLQQGIRPYGVFANYLTVLVMVEAFAIPGLIIMRYWGAIRTLTQKDDSADLDYDLESPRNGDENQNQSTATMLAALTTQSSVSSSHNSQSDRSSSIRSTEEAQSGRTGPRESGSSPPPQVPAFDFDDGTLEMQELLSPQVSAQLYERDKDSSNG